MAIQYDEYGNPVWSPDIQDHVPGFSFERDDLKKFIGTVRSTIRSRKMFGDHDYICGLKTNAKQVNYEPAILHHIVMELLEEKVCQDSVNCVIREMKELPEEELDEKLTEINTWIETTEPVSIYDSMEYRALS